MQCGNKMQIGEPMKTRILTINRRKLNDTLFDLLTHMFSTSLGFIAPFQVISRLRRVYENFNVLDFTIFALALLIPMFVVLVFHKSFFSLLFAGTLSMGITSFACYIVLPVMEFPRQVTMPVTIFNNEFHPISLFFGLIGGIGMMIFASFCMLVESKIKSTSIPDSKRVINRTITKFLLGLILATVTFEISVITFNNSHGVYFYQSMMATAFCLYLAFLYPRMNLLANQDDVRLQFAGERKQSTSTQKKNEDVQNKDMKTENPSGSKATKLEKNRKQPVKKYRLKKALLNFNLFLSWFIYTANSMLISFIFFRFLQEIRENVEMSLLSINLIIGGSIVILFLLLDRNESHVQILSPVFAAACISILYVAGYNNKFENVQYLFFGTAVLFNAICLYSMIVKFNGRYGLLFTLSWLAAAFLAFIPAHLNEVKALHPWIHVIVTVLAIISIFLALLWKKNIRGMEYHP